MTKFLFKFFLVTLLCGKIFANPSTIIVTCATGELGSVIAKLLARDHHLILMGRDASKLAGLQEQLKAENPWNYQTAVLDYSSVGSFTKMLVAVQEPIEGVVLITPRPNFGSNLLQAESEWLRLFQMTFTGPAEVLKGIIPFLSSDSKIVIIGGTTSVQLMPEYGPACMIRRMWSTYAKALAHQLGPKGIRVNVLSPGVVLTNFHQERIGKKARDNRVSFEEQMEKEVADIPLRRHAQPVEIAQTIKFLLSSESNFITGINLVIDGGTTVSY